jgi:hypothetical protein
LQIVTEKMMRGNNSKKLRRAIKKARQMALKDDKRHGLVYYTVEGNILLKHYPDGKIERLRDAKFALRKVAKGKFTIG